MLHKLTVLSDLSLPSYIFRFVYTQDYAKDQRQLYHWRPNIAPPAIFLTEFAKAQQCIQLQSVLSG